MYIFLIMPSFKIILLGRKVQVKKKIYFFKILIFNSLIHKLTNDWKSQGAFEYSCE